MSCIHPYTPQDTDIYTNTPYMHRTAAPEKGIISLLFALRVGKERVNSWCVIARIAIHHEQHAPAHGSDTNPHKLNHLWDSRSHFHRTPRAMTRPNLVCQNHRHFVPALLQSPISVTYRWRTYATHRRHHISTHCSNLKVDYQYEQQIATKYRRGIGRQFQSRLPIRTIHRYRVAKMHRTPQQIRLIWDLSTRHPISDATS